MNMWPFSALTAKPQTICPRRGWQTLAHTVGAVMTGDDGVEFRRAHHESLLLHRAACVSSKQSCQKYRTITKERRAMVRADIPL